MVSFTVNKQPVSFDGDDDTPLLSGTSPFCVFDAAAHTTTFPVDAADGDAGYPINCN